jgi:hypothetical protein
MNPFLPGQLSALPSQNMIHRAVFVAGEKFRYMSLLFRDEGRVF